MSNHTCIYHANCADGFGAALAVHLSDDWPDDTMFIPAHYGDDAPDVTDQHVIIVDFSYPRDVLERMHDQAASLLVLDHHKTAQAALDGLDYAQFDMDRSGAMMAWEHLHTDVPLMVAYLQDRDLWQWQLDKSREVSAALASYPMDFEVWTDLLNSVYDLAAEGVAIRRYQDSVVIKAVSGWHKERKTIELGGHEVPWLNCTTLISETCGELAKGYPFAATYFDTADKRIVSLRVRDGDVDVSEIAKAYGGGGHAKAAGFTLPLPD